MLVIFSEDMQTVLMCKRKHAPYQGLSNFPGGKIEKGEDGLHAAYRELQEETAITEADVLLPPTLYGREVSQSVIGIQMAFSNLSILLTPILFGVVSRAAGIRVFPVFLACMFVLLVVCTVLLYFYSAKPRGSKRANQKENR